ncbi:MAG: DUF4175 family protein, partial [Flavobacteriaceae bacterium]|nr:DUF4175 family protein [Flavobacteriaceae bacterium]
MVAAGIQQKTEALKPFDFSMAVSFKTSLPYLRYAIVPVLIIFALFLLGRQNMLTDSYQRVVNYNTAYVPPAPYQFYVLNDSLHAIQYKDFELNVAVDGEKLPERVSIHFNGQTYFMQKINNHRYRFRFDRLENPLEFTLSAPLASSLPYTINLIEAPSIYGIQTVLTYPSYTGIRPDTIISTGNFNIPENTVLRWNITAESADEVLLSKPDTIITLNASENSFIYSERVKNSFDYSLSASNQSLKNYNKMPYKVKVTKDKHPEIEVQMLPDSLDDRVLYFKGTISDDYGFSSLRLKYESEAHSGELKLERPSSNFSTFYFVFNENDFIDLKADIPYKLYFEIRDNDHFNGFKSTRSRSFNYRVKTEREKREAQILDQKETLNSIQQSLQQQELSEEELKDFIKQQKEGQAMNFNEKQRLNQLLENQKKQQNQTEFDFKKLENILDELKNPDNPMSQKLEERLQESMEQLEENNQALKELEELMQKLDEENFLDKLEELETKSNNQKKNLEQMLELTKRFYIIEKHQQMAEKLQDIQKKQEAAAEDTQ